MFMREYTRRLEVINEYPFAEHGMENPSESFFGFCARLYIFRV